MTSNNTSRTIGTSDSTNKRYSIRVRVRREGPYIRTRGKTKGMGDLMQGRGIGVGHAPLEGRSKQLPTCPMATLCIILFLEVVFLESHV